MVYTGIVHNGVIVLEGGMSLPEGTRVRLEELQRTAEPETLGQRLMKFAGTAQGLPADMAANHDHYLHGRPKP
jgi:hypothetical protein